MHIRQLVATGTLIATLSATMLAGISALDGATAQAAPPGTHGGLALTLAPAAGSDTEVLAVRTSAGCSAAADGYNVMVTGPGAFADGFFIIDTNSVNFSTTHPINSAFGLNMRDAATQLDTSIVAGKYVVTFNCVDSLGDVTDTFVGSIYFTSPTAYQTTDPAGPPATTTPLAARALSTIETSATATSTTGASTTPPTSIQTTTTTPSGGCSLTLKFATIADLPPFLIEENHDVELADLEAFFADLDADLNALEAFAVCLAGPDAMVKCETPTAINFEPFRDGEDEDIEALFAEVGAYFTKADAFLVCLGADPTGGSSTTTSPTPITSTNPPLDSGSGTQNIVGTTNIAGPQNNGGTQNIGVSTSALGQTGGPVGLIFLGGLVLVAAGLTLIIVASRPGKALNDNSFYHPHR